MKNKYEATLMLIEPWGTVVCEENFTTSLENAKEIMATWIKGQARNVVEILSQGELEYTAELNRGRTLTITINSH